MSAKRPPNLTITLPCGIQVEFWDEVGVDGQPQRRRYAYNGQQLVSVSTVAGIYNKPALPRWAARVTLEGVERVLATTPPHLLPASAERLASMLRERGLDHDSVRDQAAQRGTSAHDMFLRLLRDGTIPRLSEFPESHRPYIQAGAEWWLAHEPQVIDCEQIVASVEHGFAGRYDLHARFADGRTGRIDFKTVTAWGYGRPRKDGSRDLLPPYPEHLSQVEGYEIAAVESGFAPSDFRAVVRLGPDGEYDMCESWATAEHFLGDLLAYRNRQALNAGRPRKTGREAVAA